jgi:serine phosphatase RsbU (regulator of sigma subunit)
LTADGSTALAVLADGLGHGPEALIAAGRASALVSDPRQPPEQLLQAAHEALHGTRGAAVLCVQIDLQSRVLRHAGVGNVTGVLIDADGRSRQLLSHGGIVGHQRGRVQAFELEWKPASMLVLHSDGISTHWRPEAYPGLLARHPALLTAALYRDFSRGRDDACVVVIREGQP